MEIIIRPLQGNLKGWVSGLLEEHWGSEIVVTRGKIHKTHLLPGFIAIHNENPVGLLTYDIDHDVIEIVTLNSLIENIGIGSALLEELEKTAIQLNCCKMWLITTNDNIHAIRFYQRKGFCLVAVYRNAIQESRKLKPQIPYIGFDGIPIRDEIEFEKILPYSK